MALVPWTAARLDRAESSNLRKSLLCDTPVTLSRENRASDSGRCVVSVVFGFILFSFLSRCSVAS